MIEVEEVWKPVVYENFKNYYEVSNYGNVKSKERDVWHPRSDLDSGGFYMHLKERILRPCISNNKTGYPTVVLNRESKTYNIAIHILVYTSFVGEIPKGMTINHKDGNKENTFIDNLELITYGENIKHAVDVLKVNTSKPRCNFYINNLYNDEKLKFDNAVAAGKHFNVSPVTIKGYATGLFKGNLKGEYEVIRVIKSQ